MTFPESSLSLCWGADHIKTHFSGDFHSLRTTRRYITRQVREKYCLCFSLLSEEDAYCRTRLRLIAESAMRAYFYTRERVKSFVFIIIFLDSSRNSNFCSYLSYKFDD